MLGTLTLRRLAFRATLALCVSLLFPAGAWARVIQKVEITAVANNTVACGLTTTVTVEVTIKVGNSFVGPETGTIEIMEHDDWSGGDTVGSGTYTLNNGDIGNNNVGKVTATVTLNCYAANADCECDFGTRPDDIDDEHGEHTIYARDKDSGKESAKAPGTTGYIDIISCVKPGGKLAMSYGNFSPGQTTLVAVNFDQEEGIDQLDWTFAANGDYFTITDAWFGSTVADSFDGVFVNFGDDRPGEVSFFTLNEIRRDVLLDGDFDFFFEVAVSPEAPYGEFSISTVGGSALFNAAGRMIAIEHPNVRVAVLPEDHDAPEIDVSLMSFDATNLSLDADPGAIYDDYLGAIDSWVDVAVALVDTDGDVGYVTYTSVADDGHFMLSDIVTDDEDVGLLVIARDMLGNTSEIEIDLQPTDDSVYAGSIPSTGDGFGYFFDMGPCGQLAGWTTAGSGGVPALNVGGDVRVFDSPHRLNHGLGVNARNWIVGQFQVETGFAPFILVPDTGFLPMPTLGGGRGVIYSIDDSSRWAVGMSTANTTISSPSLPTLWLVSEEGGEIYAEPIDLPGLGGVGGSARDVNNLGTVVGSTAHRIGGYHAVIWTQVEPGEFEVRDLGSGSASAISDTGIVVGTLSDRSGTQGAFYHVAGETVLLPRPQGCIGCSTYATAVNNRGEIVGWANPSRGRAIPLYWSIENGASVVDLREEMPAELTLEGVRLESVSAINDAGQILGGGKIGDLPVPVVLTPAGVDLDSNRIPDSCEARTQEFSRGDGNSDGRFDIADPVWILDDLFRGGEPSSCLDANDLNDDGRIDVSDAISALRSLFLDGTTIAAPFPGCGDDPTPDDLGCESSAVCADVGGDDDNIFVKEACPGGVNIGIPLVRHECRGGFFNVVEYVSYRCPDGTLQWVEQSATALFQRCP